jgi:hypothetical protein
MIDTAAAGVAQIAANPSTPTMIALFIMGLSSKVGNQRRHSFLIIPRNYRR